MTRVIRPVHNNPMRYKYRARLENKKKLLSDKLKWRFVVERYFTSWCDYYHSYWYNTEEEALEAANDYLDCLDREPENYI